MFRLKKRNINNFLIRFARIKKQKQEEMKSDLKKIQQKLFLNS